MDWNVRIKYMLQSVKKIFLSSFFKGQKCLVEDFPSEIMSDERPIRAELYNVDQLERHAKSIASQHELAKGRSPDKLLPRLSDNERVLIEAYDLIIAAADRNRRIAPAAEWLLDNFYLIEEQIRSTRRLLPRSYSGELPRLANGPYLDFPRVYVIAQELIAHTDGRVDALSLNGFVTAYQSVIPLKIGELWAFPLMLRLALIENLRRVAARIATGRSHRDCALDWAERMIKTVEQSPTDLVLVLADMARENPPLSGPFIAELTRHLQGQNPNFAFAHSWLEHRLADQGQATEQLVLADAQAQASDQVSVGNSITSLRFLSVNDWRKFVTAQSLVDQTLCGDPAGVFAKMDFATRDRYRHAVEAIAKRSKREEYDVAHRAIQLAASEAIAPKNSRTHHVGYFLVDRGRPALERLMQMRLTVGVVLEKIRRRFPLVIYLGTILFLSGLILALITMQSSWQQQSALLLVLIFLPLFVTVNQLAVGIANWIASAFVRPQPLPKMDLSDGIPVEYRSLVVVPTMLSDAAGIERLIEGIEIRYLANRDPCLHFAILTDFQDSSQENVAGDAELVQLARAGIEGLNRKYEGQRSDIFFLLHRARRWNPQEKIWMGYERKRGKLADLNATLRGAQGRFSEVVGDAEVLLGVRYVITLDTDTQLPRDAAYLMVGAMSHPLNQPVLDAESNLITDGYTILQPRVGVSLPSANRSWFVKLFSGEPGVDPYTRVVSDVYQDLFGEGSFVGKGIYDVDSFEQRCANFPENAILSHDLLESCFSRSALLSDVILYEDYPSSYSADVARRHRWMRGDWQIAAWLLPNVRDLASTKIGNPINALSHWKIFDNLRRSFVPIAMLLVILLAWLLGTSSFALLATLIVIASFGVPMLLSALMDVASKPTDLPLSTHLRNSVIAIVKPTAQCVFSLIVLPYEAAVSLDAIVRTLFRLHWSKRGLLEWRTSSESERGARADLVGFFRTMRVAPAVAFVAAILMMFKDINATLFLTLPLLGLWLASPAIAWYLSRPIPIVPTRLSCDQQLFLRKLARKTWRYFETFVTAEDNWLPPDNVQVNPNQAIASRTSPTNIGMGLLADLAAFDFGYCTVARLLERTQNTFSTLGRIERYQGHLYNWYDTRTLTPLTPRYVSTVDSGNLAGQLLVLGSGLRLLTQAEPVPPQVFDGLRDMLSILLDEATKKKADGNVGAIPAVDGKIIRAIQNHLDELERYPRSLVTAIARFPDLIAFATELKQVETENAEFQWWVSAFERACVDNLAVIRELAAWKTLPAFDAAILARGPPETAQQMSVLLKMFDDIDATMTFRSIAALPDAWFPAIDRMLARLSVESSTPRSHELIAHDWLLQLRKAVYDSSRQATARIRQLEQTADQCEEFAEMDFDFLHDKTRDLFAIGYNVSENRLDTGCYDLLASEARLASYVLIAQGHFGQEHWFALGRLLTNAGGAPALLSWSGSMFEYLMPLLVMPTYADTILDQTYRAIVQRQINYGRQRGVPWGISESGYNTVDWNSNYQYRAFGVPGLGLKRGLAEDLVIAPYASALALMVAPKAACLNLERLVADGREGDYGFYEAVDYTPSRLPPDSKSVTVRQYMAHHAGMSFLSFAYVLLDKPMQRRFKANPEFQASELLLHERIPKATIPVYPHAMEANATRSVSSEEAGTMRVFTDPSSPVPEVHLLSNGQYHVAVTSAGGGYSRWRDIAVTRWREDPTRDCWGTFCYLRDLDSDSLWSNSWQPTTKPTQKYEAIFTQARAEFRRNDDQVDSHTQISVSHEDDLELRRITLINRSERARKIEITSYGEVVLATQAQDESHPAFSNLFVQSEIVGEHHAIFCTRRPRSTDERPPWMIHMMTTGGAQFSEPTYETDRMKFIGRGRTLAAPQAFDQQTGLSNSQGSTLDPIVSIRQTILMQPNESVHVDIVTGVAETREGVQAMAQKYSDPNLANRVFEIAWSRGPIMLQQLNASEIDAQAYGRLASSIVFASSLRRARPSVLIRNRRGQSGLWGYGISGDLPIVLVRIRSHERIDLVKQAVQAHAYWRMNGLSVDLVIWNEDDSVYRQSLQDSILDVVAISPEASLVDKPGGVFIRRGEQMSEDDRSLLQTVARVVLLDDAGTLIEQVERRSRIELSVPVFKPARRRIVSSQTSNVPAFDLAFFNETGGFSRDGREYISILKPNTTTPAPWVNVIANSQIGTVVSESGGSYTWVDNSHEYRLTPWANDPVSDRSGEAFYIRDEETGRFWSPSPLPTRGENTYVVRHGFGYSIFDYSEDGITTELCVYVATDGPVKFVRLKITNRSGRARHLSITGYWEWVLGEIRSKSLMHVVTEIDPITGAIFAKNMYSHEFANKVAFVECSETARTYTGDRSEFIGRNGTPANPAAMRRTRLSNRTGAGFDPCAAIQTHVSLDEGQEKIVVFAIGAGNDEEDARRIVQRFRGEGNAQRALEAVWHYWSHTLSAIYVETPDPAVNFLANGWLVYQTLVCRMWARTGFYQSGGAYGFRDQLQDAMALVHAEPLILREHLLRACGRQFREGDVQHWWHPPAGRGVRTCFSDDYLWLPMALCRYVHITGDTGVLDERIPFLSARALNADEEANYDLPHISDDTGTVYEHAMRAVDHGLRFGVHGLPLMGCGDWNDGMNLVGQHGQGESVWLAFFMYDVLTQFSSLATLRNDASTADRLTVEAGRLRGNIEQHGWDGEWYRRAYFDDGRPLGSSQNEECQIDSISQSWSIISGAGTQERSSIAMESLDRRLVRRKDHLIQLLDPPFDKSDLNPGYIKGYVPGVRENGGQYTHAAIWTVMAFAALGDKQRAWELFSMINPVNHGSTKEAINTYRVEPYVVAADVYGVEPHTGRGGWTWYTGSAGWMYRLIIESILGLQLEVDKLRFTPHAPKHWPSFTIHYRYRETIYHIRVVNSGEGSAIRRLTVDGIEQMPLEIILANDRQSHQVEIELE